jgi:hypothetical protein
MDQYTSPECRAAATSLVHPLRQLFCGAVSPFAIAWDRVAFCIGQKAHQGLELRFIMNDRPSF